MNSLYIPSFRLQSLEEVSQICKDILFLDAKDRYPIFDQWTIDTIWYFIYISSGFYGMKNRSAALKILRKYILNMKNHFHKPSAYPLFILDKMYHLLVNYDGGGDGREKSTMIDDVIHLFVKSETEHRFMEYIYQDPVVSQIIRNLAGIY